MADTDSMDAYMLEVGRHPLLTAKQERDLAAKVRAGCHASRERMIVSNLRLVVRVAKKYKGLGLDFEDLVSEGNAGLIKAVDKFDPEAERRFSTYAVHWIRERIQRAIYNKGDTIRLPVHLQHHVTKVRQHQSKTGKLLGTEGVRALLGIPAETAYSVVTSMASSAKSVEEVGDFLMDGGWSNAFDQIAADICMLDDEIYGDEFSRRVQIAVSSLSDREKMAMRLRFGFDCEDEHRYGEIAEKMGINRNTLRGIKETAFRKLRTRLSHLAATEFQEAV